MTAANPVKYDANATSETEGAMPTSPYLEASDRLADVIAAIQVLGKYKFYKKDFAGWSYRITGSEANAAHWERVFREHPEFFRISSDDDKASLVIRRQHQKLFHVDKNREISKDDYRALSRDDKERVSRLPLTSGEIAALVNTAIEMHSRALENEKESRWWLPVLTAVIAGSSGIAGTLLGAWLSSG